MLRQATCYLIEALAKVRGQVLGRGPNARRQLREPLEPRSAGGRPKHEAAHSAPGAGPHSAQSAQQPQTAPGNLPRLTPLAAHRKLEGGSSIRIIEGPSFQSVCQVAESLQRPPAPLLLVIRLQGIPAIRHRPAESQTEVSRPLWASEIVRFQSTQPVQRAKRPDQRAEPVQQRTLQGGDPKQLGGDTVCTSVEDRRQSCQLE